MGKEFGFRGLSMRRNVQMGEKYNINKNWREATW